MCISGFGTSVYVGGENKLLTGGEKGGGELSGAGKDGGGSLGGRINKFLYGSTDPSIESS